MTAKGDEVIRVEARTVAPAERVWAAWTDPARIAEWFVDAASGEVVAGGTFMWVWEKFGYVVPQRVVELEPGRRLVLESDARGRQGLRVAQRAAVHLGEQRCRQHRERAAGATSGDDGQVDWVRVVSAEV